VPYISGFLLTARINPLNITPIPTPVPQIDIVAKPAPINLDASNDITKFFVYNAIVFLAELPQ